MKYCPKCGTQNGDEAKFATDRQHEKKGSGSGKPSSPYPSYPEQSGRSTQRRLFLLIAAAIVILGTGGFAIWKFVVSKNASPKSELENVDLGASSSASAHSGTVNPEFEKFIGDWYSDNANIKRTRISAHGDLLLVETFFKDGIDSCYGAPSGNGIRCSGDFQVSMLDAYCIEGYFSIRFCKR